MGLWLENRKLVRLRAPRYRRALAFVARVAPAQVAAFRAGGETRCLSLSARMADPFPGLGQDFPSRRRSD
ncbi:MAG: hypothetical protein INF93_07835 [Rhodobacter sp.]|nr:hypothetical protein [Rhodobacter sp.]